MIKLISILDIKEIMIQGSEFCENARKAVSSSDALFVEFSECPNPTDITILSKKTLFDDLVRKAFNARMGAEKKEHYLCLWRLPWLRWHLPSSK